MPTAADIVYVPVVSPTSQYTASDAVSASVSPENPLSTATNVVFVPVKDQLSSTPFTFSTSKAGSSIVATSTTSTPNKDRTSSSLKAGNNDRIAAKVTSGSSYLTLPAKDRVVSTSTRTRSTLETGSLITGIPDKDKDKLSSTVSTSNKPSGVVVIGSLITYIPDKDRYTSAASISNKVNIASTSSAIVIGISNKNNYTSPFTLASKIGSAVVPGSIASGLPDKDKSTSTVLSSIIIDVPDKDKDKSVLTAILSDKTSNAVKTGFTTSSITEIPAKDRPSSVFSISNEPSIEIVSGTTAIRASDKVKPTSKASSDNDDKTSSLSVFTSLFLDKNRPFSLTSSTSPVDNIDIYAPSSSASLAVPEKDRSTSIPVITGEILDSSSAILSSSIPSKIQIPSSPQILVPAQRTTGIPPKDESQQSVSSPNNSLPSTINAPITSTVVPVWTPTMLGNAYGGGFVTTPSVFVTYLSDSPRSSPGIPPGYEVLSEDSQLFEYVYTRTSIVVRETTTSVPASSNPGAFLTKSGDDTPKPLNSATASDFDSVSIDQTAIGVSTKSLSKTSLIIASKESVETSGNSHSSPTSLDTGFILSSTTSKQELEKAIATPIVLTSPTDESDKLVSQTQSSASTGKDEVDKTSYPASLKISTFSKVTLSTTTISNSEKDNPTTSSLLLSTGASISGPSQSVKVSNYSVVLALSPTSVPEFQGLAFKHTMGFTIGLVFFSALLFF